jgi:glycosyltransferase involved in cell wall biosynthesis
LEHGFIRYKWAIYGFLLNNIGQDMKKLKIAVYAISKNEEEFVNRFCDSAKDADLVLIADTGSTDRTVELAIQNGAKVYDIAVRPWRFDKARDTALNLIPSDFDVCISLDLDEILEPGWREEIERVWQENTTRLRYKFDWGCGISFFYEKIHHRTGYHWHHPVHEYPRPDNRTVEKYAHTDMLLVSHHPDPKKSRGQYMPLLELAIAEDPRCPRNAFYHARELTFYYRWDDAIKYLQKYLDMPEATWQNERCYAMRLMGKAYENLNQYPTALKWYRLSVAEAPGTREPWVELSMLCYKLLMWNECFSAAMSALEIKDKQLVYTMDPSVWTEKPHDLASISAWNMGLHDIARQQLEEALKFAPNDARLLSNRELMKVQNDGINSDRSPTKHARGNLYPTVRANKRPLETA